MRSILAGAVASMLLSIPGASAKGRSPTPTSDTLSALEAALAAYEDLRALLAADTTGGVAEASGRIRAASRRAARDAPVALREPIEALRRSSAELERRARSGEPIGHLRWAFGDASRAVVMMLGLEMRLTQGRFVFQCPVTHTYDKWVQTTDRASNPYLGTRLPSCGVPVR